MRSRFKKVNLMIHHVSIPAENPRRVADVLSELWSGQAFPFPPSPESYVVFPHDNNQGTCIEVYPLGTKLIPGKGDQQVHVDFSRSPAQLCEFHAAISVPLSLPEVEAIAVREGWRAVVGSRGGECYQIVEFWVENRLLLELLTPEMLPQYSAFMTPQNWEQFFDLELVFNANSKRFDYKSRLEQFAR